MEHGHRCVYCGTRWFCYEDCLFAGPSACATCSKSLVPGVPRRLIPLRDRWMFARLAELEAERFREKFRRDRPL